MRWLLSVVITPGKDNTLLDEFLEMDEDFWDRMGLGYQ